MYISKQLSCRSVGSFDLPQLQFYCSHKHGEQNGRQVYPIVVFYPSMGFFMHQTTMLLKLVFRVIDGEIWMLAPLCEIDFVMGIQILFLQSLNH